MAMSDKEMKGTELENSIAENMHEISVLKHRNKELNIAYEDTRLKLRKSEQEEEIARTGRDEATISMNHALEMSKTWQETVKSLKRQMKEERARVNEANFNVF